jgi:Ca-activated chloride channel family protein
MSDIRFDQLESLHWLWVVAALGALLIVGLRLRRRALARLATESVLGRILPGVRSGRPRVRVALLLVTLILLVAALIDPRWGLVFRPVQQRGNDVMIVLDVSRSMLAEDVRPNRLARAKQDILDLVDQLRGDRVGLVTFAGVPAVKCPLTVDYGALRLTLETVTVESAARGGSLLGDAIRLAADSFTDERPENKVIIVLSDGEDHGSYATEAAGRAFEQRGIPVHTVGIGDSEEGSRIPVEVNGQRTYLVYEGQQVWSRMNEALLRETALAGGGAFVPAGTASVDLGRIYIERLEPAGRREFERTQVRRREPRYQWFAALALVALLVESFLGDQRRTDLVDGMGEEPS